MADVLRMIVDGLLIELAEKWSCPRDRHLENRLNSLFGWEQNTPNLPHILEQAAAFFDGEILTPIAPRDPEKIY